jgi:hypothetical protein
MLGGWPTFDFLLPALSRLRLPHLPRVSEGGNHGPRFLPARQNGVGGAHVSKIAKRGAASIMMVPTTIKGRPAGPVSALRSLFYAPLNADRDATLSLASANA